MATWAEFERQEPDLAIRGRELVYAGGSGFGFLATVRPDGSPRIHPVSVAIGKGGMFITLIPSPKARDLAGRGSFALHSVPHGGNADEFAVTGHAERVDEPDRRADIQEISENTIRDIDIVFELHVETALPGLLPPPDYWPPQYSRWSEQKGTDHPVAVGYSSQSAEYRDLATRLAGTLSAANIGEPKTTSTAKARRNVLVAARNAHARGARP